MSLLLDALDRAERARREQRSLSHPELTLEAHPGEAPATLATASERAEAASLFQLDDDAPRPWQRVARRYAPLAAVVLLVAAGAGWWLWSSLQLPSTEVNMHPALPAAGPAAAPGMAAGTGAAGTGVGGGAAAGAAAGAVAPAGTTPGAAPAAMQAAAPMAGTAPVTAGSATAQGAPGALVAGAASADGPVRAAPGAAPASSPGQAASPGPGAAPAVGLAPALDSGPAPSRVGAGASPRPRGHASAPAWHAPGAAVPGRSASVGAAAPGGAATPGVGPMGANAAGAASTGATQQIVSAPAVDVRLFRSAVPTQPDAALVAAWTALRDGRLDEAAQGYQRLEQQQPRLPDVQLGLARVAAEQGRPEEARARYRRALELDPQNATALAGLAVLEPAGASSELDSQLKSRAAGNSGDAQFALAARDSAAGQWPEAEQAWFDALRDHPGDPDVLYNLAVALDHLGQSAAARQYYGEALQAAQLRPAHFSRPQVDQRLQALGAH